MSYGRLASGRIDLSVDASLKIHDYAAFVPILEGAGGIITEWEGEPLHIGSGPQVLAAGDAANHATALAMIRKAGRENAGTGQGHDNDSNPAAGSGIHGHHAGGQGGHRNPRSRGGYGEQPVIDGLSLTIADGSLFTLLGPSGCGKTTLLRTIAGFIPVRGGVLRFGDRDVTALPAYQRDIGMVFQDYALFPDKSVFDNVAYGLRARRRDAATIKATVGEYLERVGLSAFASGCRQPCRVASASVVALARALAIKPTCC